MSRWLEKQRAREAAEQEADSQEASILVSEKTVVLETAPEHNLKPAEFKAGDKYRWKKADNVSTFYDLVRRMNTTKERLMEYNEIEDLDELEPGIDIYYPTASGDRNAPQIRYEILQPARDMHIVTKGGAKKWAFGNVRTWDDFQSSGFYPENTNIRIVAVAHVPVQDEKDPTAGFYIDSNSLGDFEETGKLRYTTGFRWTDLAEGVSVPVDTNPLPDPLAERKTEIAQALAKKKSMDVIQTRVRHDKQGFDPAFIDKRVGEAQRDGSIYAFVETYQPQIPAIPCMAFIPDDVGNVLKGQRFIWCHDFEGRRPDRRLFHYQEIDIAGTFEVDGVLYGRPQKAADNFLWYGIPMDILQSQDQVYNVPVDAETRTATGRLTFFEKHFWVPFSRFVHRKQNKK